MEIATELLGREYTITGKPVEKKEMLLSGETITHVKMIYDTTKITPKSGLYAASISVPGIYLYSVG